jgi:hypothetical protein
MNAGPVCMAKRPRRRSAPRTAVLFPGLLTSNIRSVSLPPESPDAFVGQVRQHPRIAAGGARRAVADEPPIKSPSPEHETGLKPHARSIHIASTQLPGFGREDGDKRLHANANAPDHWGPMSNPDPLLMSADIARMASERPDLDEELVQAIYQHLVLIESRQPTIDELRAYVDRVSSLDQDKLRQRLGLGARPRRGPRAPAKPGGGRPMEPGTAAMTTRDEIQPTRPDRRRTARGPGRPGWTDELFWMRYQEALDRATPPYTYRSIAPHFETLDGTRGTDPEYVRKLVGRHGVPPAAEPGSVGSSPP